MGTRVWDGDEPIYSREGRRGTPTGGWRVCRLEGCTGIRVGVRWPDGKVTFPCTKGMKSYRKGFKIV